MSSAKYSIPPLAGLATYEEAARSGPSVEDNVTQLRRFNRIEARLYEINAAALNPTPEWEVKGALSLHLYLDAEHSQALRQRVAELRKPRHHMDDALDQRLEAFLDEARRFRSTVELLVGVFQVIRPALLAAYKSHLETINPVFDFPTARLLRQAVPEEEQMISWGEAALKAMLIDETAEAEAAAWAAHLTTYLQAAGGVRWPQLVSDILGHDSTSVAGADNPLIPKFAAIASG